MTQKLGINRSELLDALVNRSHVAASRDQYPYLIAVNHGDQKPKGRVIWADTPSSMSGDFANFVGEENYSPEEFIYDDYVDIGWGEDEDDTEAAAREWIGENLRTKVDLDGIDYKVRYV